MISAVARAMAILETMSDAERGLTVTNLVTRLGIEKSVVSRILATLEAEGYVVRNPVTETFSIGIKFAALAIRRLDSVGLYDSCVPLLRTLSERTGELVQLAIATADGVTYVAKAEGTQHIRMLSRVGRQAILHSSAAGKVWLASMPEEEALKRVLHAGMPKTTARTITSIDEVRRELGKVREQGFATVVDEHVDGASAVGVPIYVGTPKKVLGAVVLSGPSYRLPPAAMEKLVPDLKEVACAVAEIGPVIRWWAEAGAAGGGLAEAEVEV